MITNSIEKELSAKKEDNTIVDKISKDSSSSRYWSGLNNPRVVRVSRSFGGKDRHSKVCTIKGLRDRRVRLSVPTAIQLYDLQHKLGLNQPSKVVDWLLNAAKDEIDELPPLQIPPGSFGQFPQSFISYEANGWQTSLASRVDGKIDYVKDVGSHSSPTVKDDRPKSTYWNRINSPLRSKCKEVAQETINEKRNWINRNEDENQGIEVQNAQVLSHNSLPRVGDSSFSGLLNSVMPQNSYYHWGHQNFPLSSLGNTGYSIQTDDPHNYNVISMPSPLSLPSASQLLFCPAPAPPSFFFPFVTSQVECNPRPINHLHMLSSTSQNLHTSSLNLTNYPPMRPLQYGINPSPRLLHSQNNNESQSNKGNGGPSSTFASTSFQNDPKAFCG